MSWLSAPPAETAEGRSDRFLRIAALVFAAGFLLHNVDHFRRGLDAISSEVLWSGTATGILSVVAIVLVLRGHPLAPLAATVVGFSMAIGVTAVHLTPHWSAFSDSLPDEGLGVMSWVAVLSEIIGAAIFGAAGLYALRHRAAQHPAQPVLR